MSTRAMYLNDLDRLTTEMMEYICDKLCRYPEMERDEESLAELCDGCGMKEPEQTKRRKDHEQE